MNSKLAILCQGRLRNGRAGARVPTCRRRPGVRLRPRAKSQSIPYAVGAGSGFRVVRLVADLGSPEHGASVGEFSPTEMAKACVGIALTRPPIPIPLRPIAVVEVGTVRRTESLGVSPLS